MPEPSGSEGLLEPASGVALYPWPEPGGSEPLPDAFIGAGRRFHAAEAEWDAGRFRAAADGFLAAAAAVPLDPALFYAQGFAAARGVAYRNAALAFRKAREPSAARAAFRELLERDPACAATLNELLAQLPEAGEPR
jgi:tetratricopeptide (TPR) repeat protein